MKKFLAVYIGTPVAMKKSGWASLTDEQRQERQRAGIEAWGQWAATHRNSIADAGTPLGKTKRVSGQGITNTKNHLVGYAIVQAESHEAAARLFENHPHFAIFPGDRVEVMECLPTPGM
jgi:hypothetical protein